jgi:adenylate cyclase
LPQRFGSINKHLRTLLFVLSTAIAVLILQQSKSGGLTDVRSQVENIIYDIKLRALKTWPSGEVNIQIVAIDELSLLQQGRMPWDRDKFALLVSKLNQYGASVIVFDVLFSEPQVNPILRPLASLNNNDQLAEADLQSLINEFDYDTQFANAIGGSEVILAMQLFATDTVVNPQSVNSQNHNYLDNVTQLIKLHQFSGYAAPIPALSARSSGIGFMNSMPDSDGSIRRSPLFLNVNGRHFPSLALETYRVYSLFDRIEPIYYEQGDNTYLSGFKLGHRVIETDEYGQMLIPYQGPSERSFGGDLNSRAKAPYPYTSASQVMNGQITDERFDQAVVFVGATAIGLGDLQVTPTGINYPGVEIHATIFDALMSLHPIPSKPDWESGAVALQILLISIIAFFIFPQLGPRMTLIIGLLTMSSTVIFNAYAWQNMFIHLSLLPLLFLSVLFTFYFVTRGFLTESAQRNRVKSMFGQYVPTAHIDRLLDDPEAINLKGERKELSVMFSDIRSFTSISESMTAEQLKDWLNQFFSPVTEAILKHEGTIDKYVGDMIMAFWGAPLEDARHASHSIDAAFTMLEKIADLNDEFVKTSRPIAEVGIGINTGEMNVGDMGSDFRRAYTVIGDAVNLGSRLEGLTKFYGVTILVSETTRNQSPEYNFIQVDKVKVKGKNLPVSIYSPLPKNTGEQNVVLAERFNQGMVNYYAKRFQQAKTIFATLLADEHFEYRKLAGIMLSRTDDFLDQPPPPDWDGSYQHTSK